MKPPVVVPGSTVGIPLWQCGFFTSGAGFPNELQGQSEGDLPFCKVGDLSLPANRAAVTTATNWVSSAVAMQLRATVVAPGSVVFPKIGAALLNNVRRQTRVPVCIDNNVVAFTPTVGHERYWYYWWSVADVRLLANPGPVPSLNMGRLAQARVPLPPLDTQRRIADMLDAETARIDTLIEKNQRVAKSLETRWAAQLEQALAAWAGGDLTVPGSVHKVGRCAPAGWRPTRIDSITAAVRDKVTLAEMSAAGRIVHYTIEELGETGEPRLDDGADVGSDKLRVRGDELLFSRLNPRKGHVFEVAVHDDLAVASGEFAIMRPFDGVTTRRFLFYYLTTPLIRGALDAGVRSVTKSQQRVSFDRIWQTAVALPPLEEQHRLVNRLDGVRAQLDELGDRIRRQNELLRLRRQALITAAVTGEIDTRGN